ncbi:MAG: Beta propeller domain, partial [Frankiales bacterium]|nr:Beta propeller domain [Frankiales bacterium]
MPEVRRSATALLVLGALGLTGCTSGREATHSLPAPSGTTRPSSPSPRATKPAEPAARLAPHAKDIATALRPYADCRAMLSGLRAEALKEVTPYGLNQPYYGGYGTGGDVMPVAAGVAGGTTGGGTGAMAAPAAAPASASGGASAGGFSTTNNQEAGVDEPDTVKTDGTVMAILRQNPASLQVL